MFLYVILAIVVVAIVVAVLMLSKKHGTTKVDLIDESRSLVAMNREYIEVLLVLSEGKDAIRDTLTDIQDSIRFLSPSTDPKVKDIDKKIKSKLEDLKLELAKKKDDGDEKVLSLIQDVKVYVAERSMYTKK